MLVEHNDLIAYKAHFYDPFSTVYKSSFYDKLPVQAFGLLGFAVLYNLPLTTHVGTCHRASRWYLNNRNRLYQLLIQFWVW
jgi:hypothetical protein